MFDKKADLAGPGISTYDEVDRALPDDYKALLGPKDRMKAVFKLKNFIEENLCKELNLFMVQVPLIVTKESGVNDYLDRDGSRTPIEFPCGLGLDKPIEAQVVQAATKWKRMALKQFSCEVGEGICTDMRAVRKDYFLDHDHSAYVDQWDWERAITKDMRNLDFLKNIVEKIWTVIYEAGRMVRKDFPALNTDKYPDIPKKLEFFHAEEILELYPDLPRKQRETKIIQEVSQAIFIIGIGYVLEDGYPHEMRAADYDDWITPTIKKNGRQFHGLNGDILVWNPVTRRRHELTSMGIRVTKETMVQQLKEAGQEHFLQLPYHQAILKDEIPLSIGGGIGQSRTFMYLLRAAHLGEISASVWPEPLKTISRRKNIHVLE
ncbi:Aspartate--ammonia ligase [uncultured Desulfobacterium sp.]|uniref:Aspartate--ammonia ligase n=1 Tax=uncultured Desulfobacterium sp. TaxID=201089 RepID=A0A445MSB0_9BACT|nr:Aspartate--ammonia ligase [uncultured Desulfobacterium sp.]